MIKGAYSPYSGEMRPRARDHLPALAEHAAAIKYHLLFAKQYLGTLSDYKLPYPDHSIDFCFSDQVFEHVFDYITPSSELARV